MIFERFDVEGLAHASYAVGDPGAAAIAIVDPERNVERYLDFARRHGVAITHVLETHIHADYASGARELAMRTGAELGLSAHDAGEAFEISFPHRELTGGERLQLGEVAIAVRHTPGHTPEHIAFLLSEGDAKTPVRMLTGDFLFVGSLGRPDLLGEAETGRLANLLFASVQALADLPDDLEIHPAHGAGSLCGAGMSGRPSSTLGAERLANPYLDPALSREAFVARLLGNLPPLPPYYRRMKALNTAGAPPLASLLAPRALPAAEVARRQDDGALVIDLRDAASFAAGHIPRSISIGWGASFVSWAAWVLPPDPELLLVTPDGQAPTAALAALRRVGLDRCVGFLDGGLPAWQAVGRPLQATPELAPADLAARVAAGELRLLDVRNPDEWQAGHAPGAVLLPAGELPRRLAEAIGDGSPLAIHCAGGYRSLIATSLLERAGFPGVVNLPGGFAAWQKAGLPVER